jgi:hypothetical protein
MKIVKKRGVVEKREEEETKFMLHAPVGKISQVRIYDVKFIRHIVQDRL